MDNGLRSRDLGSRFFAFRRQGAGQRLERVLLRSDKVRIAAEDRQVRRSDRCGVLLISWRVCDGDEGKRGRRG